MPAHERLNNIKAKFQKKNKTELLSNCGFILDLFGLVFIVANMKLGRLLYFSGTSSDRRMQTVPYLNLSYSSLVETKFKEIRHAVNYADSSCQLVTPSRFVTPTKFQNAEVFFVSFFLSLKSIFSYPPAPFS